jgi:hypothetical protein
MSHFTVAVFTEPDGLTVDELLEPFDENMTVDRYISYTKQQIIERSKQAFQSVIDSEEFKQYIADPEHYAETHDVSSGRLEYLKEVADTHYWTDEQFYKDGIKYVDEDELDEEGNVFSTYNPKSKWDWYEVGGRWSDMLKLKDGTTTDSAQVKDLDLTPDPKAYNAAIRFWEV